MLQLRLELKQTQKIIITPQLRQAIKLLQLSALELESYIENEMRENPLLSLNDPPNGEAGLDGREQAEPFEANGAEIPAFDARGEGEAALFTDPGDAAEAEHGDTHLSPQHTGLDGDWPAGEPTAQDYDLLASIAPPATLAGHLREQAALAFSDPADKFIADYLIDLVDADGYIRTPLEEIARGLGVDPAEVERILKVLQSFDPPGVCARSLSECLALQLKEKGRLDPFMKRLLARLDLLAACDFPRLKRICGVDTDDLAEMIAEVRALNPKPGSLFENPAIEMVVPEVTVRPAPQGGWTVELNSDAQSSLAVDRAYYKALKLRCRSDADRAYLAERLNSANWLIKCLEQRQSTILKVATAIVEEQAAFFEQGVRHLKPLNLRQIATRIGMHESTVSRVTSNKAMATPRGLFEMKYFFTSAIAPTGMAASAHSSEAVRDRIRQLILNESPDDVLSDDRIVTLLKADGIEIARRTVAKYREALRLPSSAVRRRQKRVRNAA